MFYPLFCPKLCCFNIQHTKQRERSPYASTVDRFCNFLARFYRFVLSLLSFASLQHIYCPCLCLIILAMSPCSSASLVEPLSLVSEFWLCTVTASATTVTTLMEIS